MDFVASPAILATLKILIQLISADRGVLRAQPLDEVLSRNLAVAVKNSETAAASNENATDVTQSQDMSTDVQCLRQVGQCPRCGRKSCTVPKIILKLSER